VGKKHTSEERLFKKLTSAKERRCVTVGENQDDGKKRDIIRRWEKTGRGGKTEKSFCGIREADILRESTRGKNVKKKNFRLGEKIPKVIGEKKGFTIQTKMVRGTGKKRKIHH